MFMRLVVATLAAGIILAGEVPTVDAQQPPKQHSLDTKAARSQLREAIAGVMDLDASLIEVHKTNTIIRVRLVNTPYNRGPASERARLASAIAALFAQRAKSEFAFDGVVIFHIEFVKRRAWSTRTVDIMEFRKGEDGAFAQHRTRSGFN